MKIVLSMLIAFTLLGCATQPTFDYNPGEVQEIGILVLLEDSLTHSHVGTTVFNNSTATLKTETFVPSIFVERRTEDVLGDRGYKVTSVKLPDDFGLGDKTLLHAGWSGLGIRGGYGEPLGELIEANDFDLLLVFEGFFRHDHMGGSSVGIGGFGLYTRSFLGAGMARVYANVRACGILADPVVYVDCGATSDTFSTQISELNAETAQEIEKKVQLLFEKVIDDAVIELNL